MSQSKAPHPIQRLLDNPWLLLALGVLVPIVSYTIWGLIEVEQMLGWGPAFGLLALGPIFGLLQMIRLKRVRANGVSSAGTAFGR